LTDVPTNVCFFLKILFEKPSGCDRICQTGVVEINTDRGAMGDGNRPSMPQAQLIEKKAYGFTLLI